MNATVTEHDLEDLRKLQVRAKGILKTRKSHTAPQGVIAIIADTVDNDRANTWFAEAKSRVSDIFGKQSDLYTDLAASSRLRSMRSLPRRLALLMRLLLRQPVFSNA